MDILRGVINQDSLRELENMSQRLNGVLRGRGTPREDREEAMALADWIPMVDVVETEGEFLLHAELPGVEKKDVKLSIERGVLTLAGQRISRRKTKAGGTIGSNGPMGVSREATRCLNWWTNRIYGRISEWSADSASAEIRKGQAEIYRSAGQLVRSPRNWIAHGRWTVG